METADMGLGGPDASVGISTATEAAEDPIRRVVVLEPGRFHEPDHGSTITAWAGSVTRRSRA